MSGADARWTIEDLPIEDVRLIELTPALMAQRPLAPASPNDIRDALQAHVDSSVQAHEALRNIASDLAVRLAAVEEYSGALRALQAQMEALQQRLQTQHAALWRRLEALEAVRPRLAPLPPAPIPKGGEKWSIRLDPALIETTKQAAARQGLPPSRLVGAALRACLAVAGEEGHRHGEDDAS
jgi:hypothetical protein